MGNGSVKFICNAHAVGGGEMSSCNLMRMLVEAGFDVELHPTLGLTPMMPLDPRISVRPGIAEGLAEGSSDILVLYANDAIYNLNANRSVWERLLAKAKRKVVVLNFDIGDACEEWFLGYVDKFIFLCGDKQREFLEKLRLKKRIAPITEVLAPPISLDLFYDVSADYSRITFIRLNRYGGKFDSDSLRIIDRWLGLLPDAHYWFMDTPQLIRSRYGADVRFHLLKWNEMTQPRFLSHGSLFHYRLPAAMRDQGPRVICEAMACGIPCIGDNRDGAKDRITPETGWLCNDREDYIATVKAIINQPDILAVKGRAAKKRAFSEFRPQRWIETILG
jgi:glycosyltransferase involved in cell wall biosynthesis